MPSFTSGPTARRAPTSLRREQAMLLTVKEFAEEQGVSDSTVRRWIREGLPTTKGGPRGATVIDLDDAEDWLDDHDEEDEDDLDDEDDFDD